VGGAALAAAALTLAACSSSSSPASTATSGSAATAGAAGTSSSSASGGATPAEVSAAQSAVTSAAAVPTTIPVTTPLPSAPPKGKTVLFLQCEQAECGIEASGEEAAAKAVGWNVKVLNFQAANPATLVAALQQGLEYHPVAAFFSGVPQADWESEQKAYAAAGAVIVDNFNGTVPTGAGVLAGRGYAAENGPIGTALADEQIATSNGAPTKSLIVTVPSYTTFGPMVTAYKAQIAKECSGCQVTEVDVTIPQLLAGGLDQAVVSAAKRISGLQYIVSVNGEFIGQLPGALKSAGLAGKYQLISGSGVSTDQQNVLNGTQLATVSSPYVEDGWQDIDMAIRHVMNLPIPAGDNVVPWTLLTKSNIGTPADSWEAPSDYPALFEKLWHVG
jgi:ribose transport system substrate-binding protein